MAIVFTPACTARGNCSTKQTSSTSIGCCGSPCSALFFFFLIPFFLALLPTIVQIFLFAVVAHTIASGIACIVQYCATHCSPACRHKREAREHMKQFWCSGMSTTREQLNQEPNDMSWQSHLMRTHKTSDGICVYLGVPGISSDDLTVSVVDQAVHVQGETKKTNRLYRIDRKIPMSPACDMETIKAEHANGELTITVRNKVGKRITIEQPAKLVPVEADKAAKTKEVTTKHAGDDSTNSTSTPARVRRQDAYACSAGAAAAGAEPIPTAQWDEEWDHAE